MNPPALEKQLRRLANEQQLPSSYADNGLAFYPAVIDWLLAELDNNEGSSYLLGIHGAQGTGKTTLAELLSRYLRDEHGKTVVNISIDDFYLTRAERQRLASKVHPLLQTRGPPGTHDIGLALQTLRHAMSLGPSESMRIPRFDKATDDRAQASVWPTLTGPVDIVILEGWCLGCTPIAPEQLAQPINALERDEDRAGAWRRFVNDSIESYQPLFALVGALVMLKAPSFDAVIAWRLAQERKLRQSAGSALNRVMTEPELARFMQLFERVSRTAEAEVVHRANVVCQLDENHQIEAVTFR